MQWHQKIIQPCDGYVTRDIKTSYVCDGFERSCIQFCDKHVTRERKQAMHAMALNAPCDKHIDRDRKTSYIYVCDGLKRSYSLVRSMFPETEKQAMYRMLWKVIQPCDMRHEPRCRKTSFAITLNGHTAVWLACDQRQKNKLCNSFERSAVW